MPGEANPCLKGLIISFFPKGLIFNDGIQALYYVELSMS